MEPAIINEDFYNAIRSLITSLGDATEHVVFVGGFANALYEYVEHANSSGLGDLYTKDIDLLTKRNLKESVGDLSERLERGGFKVELKGSSSEPVTKFCLKNKSGNFEVEFLCPKYGGDPDRKGKDQNVTWITDSVTAQPLRYMDLPLENKIELSTECVPKLKGLDKKIYLPSPGAYLIQKFIVIGRRQGTAAKEKDYMYCYELLAKFRDNLDYLANEVNNVVAWVVIKKKNYKLVKSFKDDFKKAFATDKSVGIIAASKELEVRRININPGAIQSLFEEFFEALDSN